MPTVIVLTLTMKAQSDLQVRQHQIIKLTKSQPGQCVLDIVNGVYIHSFKKLSLHCLHLLKRARKYEFNKTFLNRSFSLNM